MCKIKLEKERKEESQEEFRERGCYIKREKKGYSSRNEDGRREEDRFEERKGRRTREREREREAKQERDMKRENRKESRSKR